MYVTVCIFFYPYLVSPTRTPGFHIAEHRRATFHGSAGPTPPALGDPRERQHTAALGPASTGDSPSTVERSPCGWHGNHMGMTVENHRDRSWESFMGSGSVGSVGYWLEKRSTRNLSLEVEEWRFHWLQWSLWASSLQCFSGRFANGHHNIPIDWCFILHLNIIKTDENASKDQPPWPPVANASLLAATWPIDLWGGSRSSQSCWVVARLVFWGGLTGCWCNNHLEEYEFVNGKDDLPYILEKKWLKPPTSFIPLVFEPNTSWLW